MTRRLTTSTVTFKHPFAIEELVGWRQAGSYVVDTKEKLPEALSIRSGIELVPPAASGGGPAGR